MGRAAVDRVVVNSAGCGSAMKDYGELFDDTDAMSVRAKEFSARVVDVLELLSQLEPIGSYGEIGEAVAVHDACHLAFAQGLGSISRSVLSRIPGLELKAVGGLNCCGSGGLYSLLEPELAETLGQEKAEAVLATGAPTVASANPGCTLQLRRYLGENSEVVHPITLLARSLAAGDR